MQAHEGVPLSALLLVKNDMDEVARFISMIDNKLYAFILTLKYIDLLKNHEIANTINYSLRQTDRFIAAAKLEACKLYSRLYK